MTTGASTASCTGTENRAPGLDVTEQSPLMQMAGPGTTMNMNGEDASAAAGLNSSEGELALHRPCAADG